MFYRPPITPRATSDMNPPQGVTVEAPYVLRPGMHYVKSQSNRDRPESCIYVQLAPPAPASNTMYSGYPPMANALPEAQSLAGFDERVTHKRAPRWCDAETRHLLNIWTEEYPNIGKVRNAKEWERISRKLNRKLSDNGMVTFRTAYQCKVRMKYLIDEYNKVRRQSVSSEEDEVTCDYYEEIDAVLGNNPFFTVKVRMNSGLATTASALNKAPVSDASPLSPPLAYATSGIKTDFDAATNAAVAFNSAPLTCTAQSTNILTANENELPAKAVPVTDSAPASSTVPEDSAALDRFGCYTEHEGGLGSTLLSAEAACGPGAADSNVVPCLDQRGRGEKRDRPQRRETRKKTKKATEEGDQESKTLTFLREYLVESEKRDREFILQLTQLDREREERGREHMMNMMLEIAKLFKDNN